MNEEIDRIAMAPQAFAHNVESGESPERKGVRVLIYGPDIGFCASLRMIFEDQYAVFTTTDPELFLSFVGTFEPDVLIVQASPSPKVRKCLEMAKQKRPRVRILLIASPGFNEQWICNKLGTFIDVLVRETLTLDRLKETLRALLHE